MPPTSREWEPILHYWLGSAPGDPVATKAKQPLWFASDAATDGEIHRLFDDTWAAAGRGELDSWAAEPRGALALVILLDQFSRNLARGHAGAFAHDARALAASIAVIDAGDDRDLFPSERMFLYLPFEHAEDPALQARAVDLFLALVADAGPAWSWLTEDALRWARLHQEIIERFGRFPHRNHVLVRASTPEEDRYLAEGGAKFGQ
jgi:uncharacterized protein (DUF924 family)